MADPAQKLPASSAARKMRDASPVRVVGNLPNSQAANDNDRAREFIRERQGRILPTLSMAPANDNASEDEESDVYGAGQRESEARMRAINQGSQDEGYEDEIEEDQITDDQTDRRSDADEQASLDQETQNALNLQRQRALEEAETRRIMSESEETEEVETEQQTMAEQMAKKKAKSMLKAEIGSTGVGLIIVWLWWNYEVIIEGNQPAWKILLVLLLDLLLIALAIAPWVLLIVTLSAVASAVTSVLPDSIIQLLR